MSHPFGPPLAALALTGILLLATNTGYAQTKHVIDRSNLKAVPGPNAPVKGVKAPGNGPAPAPTGWPPAPAGTQYFRLTTFRGYYDIQRQKYYYFSTAANKWIGSGQPPIAYRNQDPSTFGAQPITYRGNSPWTEKRVEPGQPVHHNGPAVQPATQPTAPPANTGRPAIKGQQTGGNQ